MPTTRVDVRRIGLVATNAAALLLLVLITMEPLPGDVYEYASGDVPRAVVRASHLMHYDAANDTTLAVFGYCDHMPCGEAFAFRGDVTPELTSYRLWLMEAEGGAPLTRAPADVPLWRRAGVDSEDDAGSIVVSPPMTLRPAWPVAIAYVVGIGALFAGAALLARLPWPAAFSLLGTAVGYAVSRQSGLLAILLGALLFAGGLVVILILLALRRKEASWGVAALVLAYTATVWTVMRFAPATGGEI